MYQEYFGLELNYYSGVLLTALLSIHIKLLYSKTTKNKVYDGSMKQQKTKKKNTILIGQLRLTVKQKIVMTVNYSRVMTNEMYFYS